jgi:hypothetical protein
MIGDEVTVTLLSVNGIKSAWDSTPPKASRCIAKKFMPESLKNLLRKPVSTTGGSYDPGAASGPGIAAR